jgi:ribosomal protein L12E/L44/L45/RPP1/RPP2
MDHSSNRTSLHSSRPLARLATLAWSLLAVSLLAALLFVRQAEAATSAGPAQTPAASFAEVEDLEAEEEWEDEEGEEEESEDEEEDEGAGTVGPLLLPPECLLHTADADVAASVAHGVVQLTIHYTSYTPTNVSVNYWLKGSKGSLQLGETKRHFARKGVFHEEAHLSEHAMSKVLAARTFIVQLDIPAAPSYCAKYSTQRLSTKHVAGSHATWSRPS